nr:hypothetical protein [Tanacetum cinerariifolium]
MGGVLQIPDVMMNDEMNKSEAYLTYLALSTGTKPPKKTKGKGKGLMNLDEALKLGKSIRKTEARKKDEEGRVDETHECLVTKNTASDEESDETDDEEERLIQRRPTGVFICRTAQTGSAKVKSNKYLKMKGVTPEKFLNFNFYFTV